VGVVLSYRLSRYINSVKLIKSLTIHKIFIYFSFENWQFGLVLKETDIL